VTDGSAGVGSEEWLRAVFETEARAAVFANHQPTPARPILVMLGGQPAAGKTRAQHAITATHPSGQFVDVTGDDLRKYHPDYLRLVTEDPLGMPAATAAISSGLIRLALNYALTHRYSVLLEGTFRDAALVTGTAARFAEAGYRVEVVAVATPAPISRLAAEQRFLAAPDPRAARWTPPDAHESALNASPGVLAALETNPAVARIQVHGRDAVLYENTRTPGGDWADKPDAAGALKSEQSRALTVPEAVAWLERYQNVFAMARNRPGYLGPSTFPAYRRLQIDAATIIPFTAGLPDSDPRWLRQEQEIRQITLNRIVPPRIRQTRQRSSRRQPPPIAPFRHRREPPRADPPGLGR
jgi:UDP-N-acetylglucosamine kinase